MNSNPCEVTVHTQRGKKRKEKKRRKTWKGKCSINLYPNTHLIYFSKKNCTFTVHVTFFQSFDVYFFNFSYIIFSLSHLFTFFTDLIRSSSSPRLTSLSLSSILMVLSQPLKIYSSFSSSFPFLFLLCLL